MFFSIILSLMIVRVAAGIAILNTVVCENDRATIDCPNRRAINITFANYGRTETDVCVHPTLPSTRTDCPRDDDRILGIVKANCDGKASCELFASNTKLGDTCIGTYKYLEVSFECNTVNTVVCEGDRTTISCPNKRAINITFATYGRTETDVCVHPTLPSTRTDCPRDDDRILGIVKGDCDGKASCELFASNTKLGDTCIGTYKYLEVNFECNTVNTVVCEGDRTTISCPNKRAINITFATYGRTETDVCVHSTLPSTRTDCPRDDDRILGIVKSDCDGKASCELFASNTKLGDTCSGTYKYLEVSFECKSYVNF